MGIQPKRRRGSALTLVLVSALVGALVVLGEPATPAVAQSASGAGEYVALSPSRILDTRQSGGTIPTNTSRDIQVTGLGGVPTGDVVAVVVDLTVINNTTDGWGLLWQTGTTRPFPASSINYVPGRAVTNAATSKVSAAGKVSYYTAVSPTDLIVDVVGYYRASAGAGGYVPVHQTRILDTRESGGKVPAGSTLDRKLRGVAGIPDSPEVTAVALNMSTFNQEASSYITVYPRGQARPETSSMSYGAWRMQTQMTLATLSADGWARFYTGATTDMLFDVVGYYTKGTGEQLVSVTPQRVIDTRYAAGFGVGPITQPLAANTNTAIKLTGAAGVPESGVGTVLINATADAGSASAGFLSFWASGAVQPGTISLTYYPNENTSNLVMAEVGSDGKVMVTNYTGTTDLVIDVVGYFTEPDPRNDPLVRAGDAPFFSHDAYAPNDRLSAKVNLGTGNLMITTADIAIPVVGGDRSVGRTYNSLGLASNSTGKTSPLFGPGWRFSEAPDHRLRSNSDGSVTYLSGTGHAEVFAAGTLAPPAGTDAALVKNADGTYRLTFPPTGTVLNFRSDGLTSSEVDRNGNTIAFAYPAAGGYPTTIIGTAGTAPGNTVNITYGGPGGKVSAMSQTADGTTRTVSYAYDAAGYLYRVTDPRGITTFDYDPATRNLIAITDPANHVTRFTYDSARRVTSVTQVITGGNAVTSYDYTTPQQTKVTDANGNPPTTYTFHPDGRMKDATDARGAKTVIEWTPELRVKTVTDPLQEIVTNLWDAVLGLDLTKVTSPAGAVTESGGYGTGATARLPGWTKDTMGAQTSYGYDPKGNLRSVTDPLKGAATITHNGDGTVSTSASPAHPTNPTVYGYTNHQLTSVTPPAGNSLAANSYTYDGFGRLRTSKSGRGMTTTLTYDSLDRVKSEAHSDGSPTISYFYDAAGNVTSQSDATGTTSFTYDGANRLLTKTTPAGALAYTWDRAGNLKTATDPAGITTYHYDIVNRLHQVDEPTGRKTLFAYDAAGRRTDTWYNTGTGIAYLGNAVVPPANFAAHAKASYDSDDQLIGLKTTRASSDADANRISQLSYAYTVPTNSPCSGAMAGRPTDIRHAVTDVVAAKMTSYCYDSAGRLTSATTPGGPAYAYGYDANTNRTSGPEGAHTVNSGDQLTDPLFSYDADGNLTAGGSLAALAYNGISQTTSITPIGDTPTAYSYAGVGQAERTRSGPPADLGLPSLPKTTALHGLLGLATETTAGATTSYVRDADGSLIAERTPSGDFYYIFDGQGSVIALVDPSGTQRAAYSYDPYGGHATATEMNGSQPPNPWRWNASYLDDTGLYKMGERYYDPTLGRFTQVDPVEGGSCNDYDYVCGDPVNETDLSGTAMEDCEADRDECIGEAVGRFESRQADCSKVYRGKDSIAKKNKRYAQCMQRCDDKFKKDIGKCFSTYIKCLKRQGGVSRLAPLHGRGGTSTVSGPGPSLILR